jgi:hypothetical protein
VEGSGLLGVSLETYCGMRMVEDTFGPEHLHRYRMSMAEQAGTLMRAAPPLLRATDSVAFSRKGPFALYTLSRYIGAERVNEALRRLLEKYRSGTLPLATSRDLYRELQAVTPDSFQYLLRDLFEKNTSWDLVTERATAKQASAGAWRLTLDVRARKVVVNEAGVETEAPMDDWIEVGIFFEDKPGEGKPYAEKHRIHSGRQTITITVPGKPTRAGIDPDNLLLDLESEDNIRDVRIER